MAAAGEKDKKAVSKIVVINDLWFFMNFCTKYECKNEIFVKKAATFSISYLYSWGKILPDNWSGDI